MTVIKVAIIETEVFGAIAHHAKCLEPGCGWESSRRDVRKDGEVHEAIRTAADTHSLTHIPEEDETQ